MGTFIPASMLAQSDRFVADVKDFGAIPGGSVDAADAFDAAYASLPASGGSIVVDGVYKITRQVAMDGSKPLSIIGTGMMGARIIVDHASGHGLLVQNAPLFSISGISFTSPIDRGEDEYLLYCQDIPTAAVTDCWFRTTLGRLLCMDNCNSTLLNNLSGASNSDGSGDTCVRLRKSSGTFSNLLFRTGGINGFGRGPCLYVSGPITSMNFANCTFAGAGPTRSVGIIAINSNSSSFTVNCSANHNLGVGDLIVIRGASISAYNEQWRVTGVPSSTQLTVATTLNPGTTGAAGQVEGLIACGYVTNADGPVNEGNFSGCLFEGLGLITYGSVGLWFDGRWAYQVGVRAPIQGWNLNGNYYDFGATGLLLHGHSEAASTLCTVQGISVNGGKFENKRRGIHAENVVGLTVSEFIGNAYQDCVDDNISVSSDIFIHGTSDVQTRGISIFGGQIGMCRFWSNSLAVRSKQAGIHFSGSGLADISMVGNQVFGRASAIYESNGALAAATRVHRDNAFEVNGTL